MRGLPQHTRGVCPELGLQRVVWVRIVLRPGGASCEVAGLAHRRPVLRTVPLRTATALLAAGVPGVVHSAAKTVPPPPSEALAGDRG